MQTMLALHPPSRSLMTLWGAQPRGDAREQDAGRVRGNGPVTRPADPAAMS